MERESIELGPYVLSFLFIWYAYRAGRRKYKKIWATTHPKRRIDKLSAVCASLFAWSSEVTDLLDQWSIRAVDAINRYLYKEI
jgi:hypothetical protein